MSKFRHQLSTTLRKRQFLLLHLSLFLLILILPLVILISQQKAQNIQRAKAATAPTLGGCQVFPADNVWNYDISNLPVHPNSLNFVNTICATRPLLNDFNATNTFPYEVVPGTQPFVPIHFVYSTSDQTFYTSDTGPYPIPPNAGVETSGTDGHVLVVDSGNCKDYEMYQASPNQDGSWTASKGMIFDLTSNALRSSSVDAAGLPMTPALVRYDEVAAGAINHALRFTVPQAANTHVWPAMGAGNYSGPNYPPMGLRFRLKASVNISSFSPSIQVILTALKHYGMFVADETSPQYAWSVSGAPDPRWANVNLPELQQIHGSDFEAVDESSLEMSPDSGQVAGVAATATPTFTPTPTPMPQSGGSISLRATATGNNSAGGATVTISKPTGTLSGDVMVAHVVVRTAGNTITPPTGWHLVLRQDSASSISTASYVKVAGATEPASYTWSFGTAGEASGGIASYIGVNTTTPVDASHAQYNRLNSNVDNAGVTTTVANDMLVYAVGITVATTVNDPAGFTEQWSTTSNSSTTSEMSQEIFSAIGATGTIQGAHNGGANSNITLLIALKPAGAAATATPTFTPTPTLTPNRGRHRRVDGWRGKDG